MPGLLHKFFTKFLEKINSSDYYFSVSAIVDLLKGNTRQMPPMPSFLIQTHWDPQVFYD